MKKKIICSLILSLLFTSTNIVQAVDTNNYSTTYQEKSIVESNNYDNVKNVIREKAESLVNGTVANETSIQYAISEGDDIIISGSSGVYSSRENRALTNDIMYGIGSVSKMYTTAAVMKLVDQGKVDLDLPLTNYIPDFKMADENYKKITPRMLLNHSSGIMGSSFNNVFLFNDNDTRAHDNLLSVLATERLKAEPGEFSVYCNDGFALAEILVERLSGMNFADYISKNFSVPLNLKNTKTPLDEFNRNNLAKTYTLNKCKEDPTENIMSIGAGGVYSSAEDLCKFTHAITSKDKCILSEKSIDAMAEKEYQKGVWANDATENMTQYGLGWDSVNLVPLNRYNITALCKEGDTLAYHSCTIAIPEYDIAMSVVSSGGSSLVNESFASAALIELLKSKGIISEILPDIEIKEERSQCMPKYLKDDYEGLYIANGNLTHISINENGTLKSDIALDNKNTEYYHTNSGFFISKDGKSGVKFVKEKNGCTYLEIRRYIKFPGLSQTVEWEYIGQQIEENNLSDDVGNAWKNRKVYLLLNDKYSSIRYARGACFICLGQDTFGYFGTTQIKNENLSLSINKIPSLGGRDVLDYSFETKDNVEYLKAADYIYGSMDCVKNLNENCNKVSIDNDGYTKWFKVPSNLNGKTLKVSSSDHGAFNVFKSNGQPINDSYVTGVNSTKLESDYYVAFVGEPNEEFDVTIY